MRAKKLAEVAKVIKHFKKIPGVGDNIANDLWLLGFSEINQLKNQDPESLYDRLQKMAGKKVCRCMLYVFRYLVYFAQEKKPEPKKLNWWYWKD